MGPRRDCDSCSSEDFTPETEKDVGTFHKQPKYAELQLKRALK